MQSTGTKTQKIVNNVCASMRAEGFSVSEETLRDCYAVASGKKSASTLILEKLAGYKKK